LEEKDEEKERIVGKGKGGLPFSSQTSSKIGILVAAQRFFKIKMD